MSTRTKSTKGSEKTPTNRKTGRGKRGQSLGGGSTPGLSTPLRIQREEEKADLQDLNKRLEIYILQQRERDASADGFHRDLELEKIRLEEELANNKRWHEEQVKLLREQRSESAKEFAEYQARSQGNESQIQQLQRELDGEKKARQDVEVKLRAVENDCTGLQSELFSAQQDVSEHENQAAIETERAHELEQEAHRLRSENQELQTRTIVSDQTIPALEEDLRVEKINSFEEVKLLKEEIAELERIKQRSDDEIRHEYSDKLNNLFKQNSDMNERKMNESLEALKNLYEEKLNGYREKLEDSGHSLAVAKEQHQKAARQYNDLRAHLDDEAAIRRELETKVGQLEEQIAEERESGQKNLQGKNAIIQQLKDAFKRKDRQFDSLMDVKIALAMEIKAYRLLIDEEESRMGYSFDDIHDGESPSKKRKRVAEEVAHKKAVEQEEQADNAEMEEDEVKNNQKGQKKQKKQKKKSEAPPVDDGASSLLISGRDAHGRYIIIRNGSSETVNIVGSGLRSKLTEEKYTFPEIDLQPGEAFRLRTPGPDGETSDVVVDDGQTVWLDTDIFAADGDEAYLVGTDDNVMASVAVISSTGAVSSGAVSTISEEDVEKASGCFVM